MDTAVGLVQSYLYMNGYFTVTEYPVLELMADGEYRTVTDVDMLALRIPGAGRSSDSPGGPVVSVDPALAVDPDRVDIIIAEVKEGKAELNASARDPKVLRAALNRFGAVPEDRIAGGGANEVSVDASRRPRRIYAPYDQRTLVGSPDDPVERPGVVVPPPARKIGTRREVSRPLPGAGYELRDMSCEQRSVLSTDHRSPITER